MQKDFVHYYFIKDGFGEKLVNGGTWYVLWLFGMKSMLPYKSLE